MDKNVIDSDILISIVIPVFNVEKYLSRCLDSVFSQKFSGAFEVIAVDDCSTDYSLMILKKYQEIYSNFIVIEHSTNKKLSVARLTGLNRAKGRYILNVDSDDYLMPNVLKDLYEKSIKYNADVLVFNYFKENEKGFREKVKLINQEIAIENKTKVQKYFLSTCWNKVVKKSLIQDLIYGLDGINSSEDLIFNIEIYLKSSKIVLYDKYCYVYFQNEKSLTRIRPVLFLESQKTILNQIKKINSKYSPNKSYLKYIILYFDKFIYRELTNIHFRNIDEVSNCKKIICHFFETPIEIKFRKKRFEYAMKYKYLSLIEVALRISPKYALAILLRG